jgi:O-methyltransferase domain
MMTPDVGLAQRLSDLTDLITPFAIQAAAELGVPDALANGPMSVDRLADHLGCDVRALGRLLRTLSRKRIFAETASGVFALAELGQPLRSDHPLSLREANLPWLPNVASLNSLAHSVRTGKPAFDEVHGANLWEYLDSHPSSAARFDQQMRSISRFEAESLLRSYDWSSVRTVADIGGGDGLLLQILLSEHPRLAGTLFERPQLAAKVSETFGDGGRFTAEFGDFFTGELPRGREVYVLKRIVYGFDDEQAVRLLTNVRRSLERGARILIVEPFTGATPAEDPYFTYRVDLLMLAVPGGRVRSEEELLALLDRTGFSGREVIRSATPAIEAVAR